MNRVLRLGCMITKFEIDSHGNLVNTQQPLKDAIWIDLLSPTQEEYHQLENELQIKLPKHHEILQIEYSSRFYEENHCIYLSAVAVTQVAPLPESHNVSFILTKDKVISIRFSDPNPIENSISQLERHPFCPKNSFEILSYLIDALIGQVANIFELFEEKTEIMSYKLKKATQIGSRSKNAVMLNETLHEIINLENALSKCYQSLSSLQLLVGFCQKRHTEFLDEQAKSHLMTLQQDIHTLSTHGEFLNQKLEFQLDSTLGLINIEQNHIIKTFTVLAMIFMPPTLVASIYGMNFLHMPEIHLLLGYPLALVLMIVTALLPYFLFKHKGWL